MKAYEYEELSKELAKVVRKYFYNFEYGTESPSVSYNSWQLKKYTFRINSSSYNYGVRMFLKNENEDMNEFKKEIKKILKDNGFTKVSFVIKKATVIGGAFGDYDTKELACINFDN